MAVVVIEVPTALGLSPFPGGGGRARGTWRAPKALRAAGLVERLDAHDAPAIDVPPYNPVREPPSGARNTAGLVDQTAALADAVKAVLDAGDRPVVVGGDCSVLLGATLALRRRGRYGLVFVDGHLDFRHLGNSVQLSAVAGEDLAVVTGRGPDALSNIGGLRPYVADADVVALGERECDATTADVYDTAIDVVGLAEVRRRGMATVAAGAIGRLRDRGCEGAWIHIDVDVLDGQLMPAVDSPQPDGLGASELAALLTDLTGDGFAVGAEITIYDPELDPEGRCADALVDMLAAGLRFPRY